MATYEHRCRECGTTFEVTRPMAEADAPAPCPAGHLDTKRLLSVFAATGGASPPAERRGLLRWRVRLRVSSARRCRFAA